MFNEPTIYEVTLTNYQKQLLRKYSSAEKRAMLIARFFLEIDYDPTEYNYSEPNAGPDITLTKGKKTLNYEVKGTADHELAWAKLKVSSRESARLIKSKMPVLRVMNVMTPRPLVAELICGVHFDLVEEPRWRVTNVA